MAFNDLQCLSRYRCHKVVHAAKISDVQTVEGDSGPVTRLLFDDGKAVMAVPPEWVAKHQPYAGGYAVGYEDGYVSFSPAASFEAGYTRIEEEGSCLPGPVHFVEQGGPIPGYSFGQALGIIKNGFKVARAGWNGKGMWLLMQVPDAHSKMTLPYLYIEYPEGHPAYPAGSRVPWLASQTDLLAEDWLLVEG